MAKQLSVIPGLADLEIDTTRAALRVTSGGRRQRSVPAGQAEIQPDPARAKPVDEKALRRAIAADLADYLDEVPGVRPEIRSKRHRVSAPRLLRAGDRPESLGNGRLTREEKSFFAADLSIASAFEDRLGPPPTFGECGTGPCVHVGCRHTLLIEIGPIRGGKPPTVKQNFRRRNPEDLKETCSLRVAEAADQRRTTKRAFGEPVMSCEEVAELLNLTPERVRQLENEAKEKLKESLAHLRNER